MKKMLVTIMYFFSYNFFERLLSMPQFFKDGIFRSGLLHYVPPSEKKIKNVCLKKREGENIVGKEENPCNQHFLLSLE